MKNHLGKITLLLLFPILLFASSQLASTTLSSSKKDLVIKEAVVVTLIATQQDQTANVDFILEPKKSDDFKTALLSVDTQKDSQLNKKTIFKYLIFPLKSGDLTLNFNFLAHIFTSETVSDVGVGDRDIKSGKVLIKKLGTPSISLHVSPLRENVDLVGDFTLESKLQKNEINQYGAAKINYTLSGVGYVEDALNPLGEIQGVTSFSQANNKFFKATQEGYDLKKEYMYALSSKKSFIIPQVGLKAYSPKEKKYYTLKTSSNKINVSAIDPSTLVDKKESPLSRDFHIQDFKDIAIAILIFLAGFVTAKIAPTIHFKREKKQKYSDIKNASSAKELILILMQNYGDKNFEKYIDELELLQYKKSTKSLKEIKQEVLKNIM